MQKNTIQIKRDDFRVEVINNRVVIYFTGGDYDLMFYNVYGIDAHYIDEESRDIGELTAFKHAIEYYLDKEFEQPLPLYLERDDMFGNVYFTSIHGIEEFSIHANWVRGAEAVPENRLLRFPMFDDDDKDEYLESRRILEEDLQNEAEGL